MQNTDKLNTAVELVKYANIYDTLSNYLPDAVKNYRPFNFTESLTGGLVAGGVGALGGAALGSVRNMFRPKEERKKHNDALFYGALGGLGLGLPPLAAPYVLEHKMPSLIDSYQPEGMIETGVKQVVTHPWVKDTLPWVKDTFTDLVKSKASRMTVADALNKLNESNEAAQRLTLDSLLK